MDADGEMSERFKEPVLKTGDGATHRGFESHSLRQQAPAGKFGGGFRYSAGSSGMGSLVPSGNWI